MRIAVVINTHKLDECIIDTLESIFRFVGKDVLLLVNGSAWSQFESFDTPAYKLCGFRHDSTRAPYRNMALGMKTVREIFPDHDWYVYTEYDILFASDRFKRNLEFAEQKNIWMLGNDGHITDYRMPMIEAMLDVKFKSNYYLLGCCQFFHKDFMVKLDEVNFFEKFLNLTNQFEGGYFPDYAGWDISEGLYPTLCRHYGGNIGVFATYEGPKNWHGSYKIFPVRWRPELDPETENFPEASILHPLKTFEHPIRQHHRKLREEAKNEH